MRRPIENTTVVIREILLKGVNRADVGGRPIPELGFTLSAWSGDSEEESYSLRIGCGRYSEHVSNSFIFTFPASGKLSFDTSSQNNVAMFEELCELWKPEKGGLWRGDDLRWDGQDFASDMKLISRYPKSSAA